jgi:drug/metabolite transporter (DMT)-like permease
LVCIYYSLFSYSYIFLFKGVVFIARPSFIFGGASSNDKYRLINVGINIIGAVFAALAYISVRKLGKGVNPLILINYFSIICLSISPFSIFILEPWIIPKQLVTWFILAGVGFFAFIGQVMLNR